MASGSEIDLSWPIGFDLSGSRVDYSRLSVGTFSTLPVLSVQALPLTPFPHGLIADHDLKMT